MARGRAPRPGWVLALVLVAVGAGRASAASYVAYSLGVAERRLQAGGDSGEAARLGGITRLAGLVHDRACGDLLLVGRTATDDPAPRLDDLVVALRSVLVLKVWPVVSIEPLPDTARTGEQQVYFEGGVEDTPFGHDLLAADVVLKKLGLDLLDSAAWNGRSYFSRLLAIVGGGNWQGNHCTRFWFFPLSPSLASRDEVFVIKDVRVGVCAEVMAANRGGRPADADQCRDEAGEAFAAELTANYAAVGRRYPEVGRLKPLCDVLAIARGVADLPDPPDLRYWLEQYTVPATPTPATYPLLRREAPVDVNGRPCRLVAAGGIELRALELRLQQGDVTALREAVLKSRPSAEALTWPVPLGNWRIPGVDEAEAAAAPAPVAADSTPGCSMISTVLPPGSQSRFGEGLTLLPTRERPPRLPGPGDHHDQGGAGLPRTGHTDFLPPEAGPLAMPSGPGGPRPGGVLLDATAHIPDLDRLSVRGVTFNEHSGQLGLLMGEQVVQLPLSYLDDFAAIARSVYAGQDPGVSIDPGPTRNTLVVRYLGCVRGTRVGYTMFEADRWLKAYTIGRDNRSGYPVNPQIPGFKTMVQRLQDKGLQYNGAMVRFWFVPRSVALRRAGNALVADDVQMMVKTEYLMSGAHGQSEPAAQEFAQFITDHYEEFARLHSEIRDLAEYAKLTGIAKYLRERRVPLNWLLLSAPVGAPWEAPATTPGYTVPEQEAGGFTVWGGVDLAGPRVVGEDWAGVRSVVTPAVSAAAGADGPAGTGQPYAGPGLPAATFDDAGAVRTCVQLPAAIERGGGRLPIVTDVVRADGRGPVLELARYHDPAVPGGDFGPGWHLLVPYHLHRGRGPRVRLAGTVLPATMWLEDRLSGRRDALRFAQSEERAAGWYPSDETTRWRSLRLLTDGGYRLADRRGGAFHFAGDGRLLAVDLGTENRWLYRWRGGRVTSLATLPQATRPAAGAERTRLGALVVPSRMTVLDRLAPCELVLRPEQGAVYTPDRPGRWRSLSLLADSALLLEDRLGDRFYFDAAGEFYGLTPAPGQGGQREDGIELVRDQRQQVVAAKAGDGDGAWYRYDGRGRLDTVLGPDGRMDRYRYDWCGRLPGEPRGRRWWWLWATAMALLAAGGWSVRTRRRC